MARKATIPCHIIIGSMLLFSDVSSFSDPNLAFTTLSHTPFGITLFWPDKINYIQQFI